tara:strand:+ start:189 stop:1451 length:1263 start_codon:yes stop_codon:yes gene_type:complete
MAPTRKRQIKDTTSIPTWDTNKEELFRVWQKMGRIPGRFESWEQLEKEYLKLVSVDKLSPGKARAQLGVTYTNVIGKPFLAVNTSSTGKLRGIDVRSIREDINAVEELMLRDVYSDKMFDEFKDFVVKEWDVARKDISKIETYLSDFGPRKRGFFHRGHYTSALEAGGLTRDNVSPEVGKYNIDHGPKPRFDPGLMRELNIPENYLSAYYNRLLKMEGLDINPYRIDELRLVADEYANLPGEGTISPAQIEALEDRAFQLKQQGYTDKQLRQYFADQSILLDKTQTVGGPVRTIQEGVRPVEVVNTAEGGRRKSTFGAAPTPKSDLKINRGGIKYLPLVPIGLGVVTAAQQVKAGDLSGAAGTAVDTIMGEIPGVEYFVPEPTALGTLDANRNMPTPDDKPSYALPPEQRDFSRVGTQKP